MDADLFIGQVLQSIVLEDILRLYGKDASKVVVHMDSASSHTARKTYKWLDDHGIKYMRER